MEKHEGYRTSFDQDKIDATYVRKEVFKEYREAVDRRMVEIEDTLKWGFRLLIGAFFTIIIEGAIVALVLGTRVGG